MAVNKVIVDDEILIDLTKDTVTPEDVRTGVTFHTKDGNSAVGTYSIEKSEESSNFVIDNVGLVNKVIYMGDILLDLTSDTINPYDVKKGKTFHMRNGKYCTGFYESGNIPLIGLLEKDDATSYLFTPYFTAGTNSNVMYFMVQTVADVDYCGFVYKIYNKDGSTFKPGTTVSFSGRVSSNMGTIDTRGHYGTTVTLGNYYDYDKYCIIYSRVSGQPNDSFNNTTITIDREEEYLTLYCFVAPVSGQVSSSFVPLYCQVQIYFYGFKINGEPLQNDDTFYK